MQQNINLFLYLPKKIRLRLSLEWVVIICAGYFFFLMMNYSFNQWKRYQLTAQLKNLNEQLQNEEKNLQQLAKQYALTDLKDIATSKLKLEKDLDIKAKMLAQFLNPLQFSDYLVGFSQASLPGMWLTDFSISATDQKIQLHGRSLLATQAQTFLENLQNQYVFINMPFVLEELNQPSGAEEKYMSFTITTKTNTT
jgi:hypothetical protein